MTESVQRLSSQLAVALTENEPETWFTLPGVGWFCIKVYPAARNRSPRTGEIIDVPEKRLPFFMASSALLAAIDGRAIVSDEWPLEDEAPPRSIDVPDVETISSWIVQELVAGRTVNLGDFGSLSVEARPRGGRGPVFRSKTK